MSGYRILVVEHQGDAGLNYFAPLLEQHGATLEIVGPDVGKPVPESLGEADGLIVLGGVMGPTEDERAPWLPATRGLIREAVDREVPMLGICLGAQLLATATGGVVQEMGRPEVGLVDVQIHDSATEDPLFTEEASSTLPTVQWHWLEATTLPDDATVLASSAGCQNQAFRVGPSAWGVQFHPEALTRAVADWSDEDSESLDLLGISKAELVSRVSKNESDLVTLWGAFAQRFADITSAASSKRASLA